MMFLTNDERAILLIWKIDVIRQNTLFGYYKDYSIGEKKIKRLQRKLEKMGYNPDARIRIV